MLVFNPSVLNKVVKTMTPQKERVEEAQIRGTIVFSANEHFVRLDGASGDSLTPIANFAEGASDAGFVHGDRVLVLIKNHQAIVTKNLTTGLQAQAAKEAGGFVTVITDEGITAQRIIANDTFTNTLRANEITADEIIAGMATIDQLDANYAHITNGVIDNATIGHADVNDLDANYAHITSGVIDNATIDQANVNNLGANYAHITNGVIDNAKIGYADVNNLNANYAHITNGVIDNAKIGYADVDHLDAHYAEIDLANVNNAWIEYGAMKKAEVFDENVFDLSGDHATIKRIDASKINVANLRADNLIVRRINGQPVVGGYTLIDSTSSGYTSKNPQALGWYEFVNAQWVLSTDTTVDMTKAYYQEGNEVSLYDQEYIDNLEDGLQQQIDGAIETYTGTVVPTLVNWPYTDWYDTSVTPVHDERAKHVGDIYYVVNSAADENGYCYRFAYDNTQHAYDWVLIKDSDVTKALGDISELKTFESTTTSWIDETDEGLETIRTNHTALAGVVDKTVKESVQLWFTKANTTAPNKPTAEVTSTSTAGNAWRKVVPAYNASYPNYYYCWQYKFVDDTFGWSDVVCDIAMGETQGTARDAKNTADAALPASTFTSFESTTFKDVKDTVNEQTTKFTNMTTRLGLNSDGTGANTDIVAKESALEQTVDGISTRVGKTETKLIGMYATSSTAAGTAAKVATITPALPSGAVWDLGTGTIITVKFTNANTTSSPTLNVNSKGAKAIKTYANGNLSEAEYKWAAGSTFTFVYNGTNWLMQDSSVSVRMNSNETSITQTADSIVSLASGSTTYTKPDGSTATSTIGTTVNQTANNVLIKATRTGATTAEQQAGGTSAAALINVTPDTVKIAANHVEIDGTAVFNAVSDSATASAAMLNSELEIGGRNLHKDSENLGSSWVKANATVSDGVCTISLAGTGEHRIYQMPATGYWEIWKANTTYTVSVDAKTDTVGAKLSFQPYAGGVGVKNCDLTTDWKRYSFTFTSNENTSTSSCTYLATNGTTGNVFIRNPKLEYGNKATDWTPAPEDVQSEIDAKKSVHTLTSAYLTTGSTYATILGYAKEGQSTTFTVLDYSSENVKIGDSVRIAYAVSDMNKAIVYINGTVTAMPSSTSITITGHGLDTTIIDGGNILTNSIGANQIKAGAITANKIAIGDFNNYITANENDESSLNTGVPPTISDGWLYKSSATTSNIWLSPVVSNWASVGDKYRITGKVKAPAAGSATVAIYGRDASGTALTNQYLTTVIPTADTEVEINGIISITNSSFATASKCNVVIVFCTTSTWTTNHQAGYCKQMKCERMAGGSLIVDGAISTNSLSVGAKADVLNSNVQVGGRNLYGYGSDLQTTLAGLNNYSSGFSITTEDGYKCAHATGALTTTKYLQSKLTYTPKPQETFTFSAYVKIKNIVRGTTNPMCEFYFSGGTIDGAWRGFTVDVIYVDGSRVVATAIGFDRYITDTNWHHVAVVAHFNYSGTSTITELIPNIYLRDCTGDLYLHHVKFERGNKATDWTPAPEDVQAEIDAKKSVHTLDSSYNTTYQQLLTWTAPTYTGGFAVTSTAGVKAGDTCRIKATVSNMNNAVVYMVVTVNTVESSTSINATGCGLDTTIIDGGNILTNSIGANQIAANAITAEEIATGAITANKIAAGAITASKISIGDYNNYITVNENDPSSLILSNPTISDGWLYYDGTTTNAWLSPSLPNWSTEGERYIFTGIVKAAAAGRFHISLLGRDADGNYANVANSIPDVTLDANTETPVSATVYIPQALAACPKINVSAYCYSGTSGSTVMACSMKQMKLQRFDSVEVIDSNTKLFRNVAGYSSSSNPYTGYIAITTPILPNRMNNIHISGYSYNAEGRVIDINVAFYNYTSSMNNATFSNKGDFDVGEVRVCKVSSSDNRAVIILGTSTKKWYYPRLTVDEALISYTNPPDTYNTGWSITTLGTSIPSTYVQTISATQYNASKTATSYITDIDSKNGITIKAVNGTTDTNATTGNYLKLNPTDGLNIYKGGVSVAEYGDSARVGKTSDTNIVTTAASTDSGIKMNVKNSAGTSSVRIADIGFDNSQGYETSKSFPKGAWYTFGDRAGTTAQRGYYSLVSGFNNIASHNASAAFGIDNNVYAPCALSIGLSNSIGDSSKTSQNSYSTANLSGTGSLAAGYGLSVTGMYQLVCGSYNAADANSRIIVGNGSSSARANVFTVAASNGLITVANNSGVAIKDASGTARDVLRYDTDNNTILGYGNYALDTSGRDTYVEGYNVILRARNKYYLSSTSGTQITSDRRLKTNISTVKDDIKSVFMSLRPITYNAEKSLDKQKHFGFIAQEVEESFMHNGIDVSNYSIVDEYTMADEKSTYKSLCYTEFIPLCVKMIQDQQKEINELKEELNALHRN